MCTSRKKHSKGSRSYLGIVWPDYLCLAIVAIVELSLHKASIYHYKARLIPIWPSVIVSDNGVASYIRAETRISYPLEPEPLPSWDCGLIVVFVPLLVIAFFQIKFQSIWDFHAGAVGVLKALVSTVLVGVLLKYLIGEPRPYFMAACQPDLMALQALVANGTYFFSPSICTGELADIGKALNSFPSGHAANSFASATFMTLYMNAKLKTFADFHSHFWSFAATIVPILGASLIAGSMYISHQHHAYDIVFGVILGALMGTLSYRTSYAAIVDFRYNHVPLPPFGSKIRFSYRFGARPGEDGITEVKTEEDNVLVWKWWGKWKHPRSYAWDTEKEVLWLRSLRSVCLGVTSGDERREKTETQSQSPILPTWNPISHARTDEREAHQKRGRKARSSHL